jgi:hypothetical protein
MTKNRATLNREYSELKVIQEEEEKEEDLSESQKQISASRPSGESSQSAKDDISCQEEESKR